VYVIFSIVCVCVSVCVVFKARPMLHFLFTFPILVDENDDDKAYDCVELMRESTPPLPLEPPPTSSIQSYLRDKSPPQTIVCSSAHNRVPLGPFTSVKTWLSQNDVSSITRSDLDNNYHFLQNGGSSSSSTMERTAGQGFAQSFYDLGVDDKTLYDMNKNPPPVWKPEDQNDHNPPPLPPTNKKSWNSDVGALKQRLNIRPPIAVLQSPNHSRPIPPPKPRSDISASATLSTGMFPGVLLSFKDDPKFNRKLAEKRQEIYGENGSVMRGRSISLNKVDNFSQEYYESIDKSSHHQQPHPILRVSSLEYDYAENNSEDQGEYLEFDSPPSSGHNSRASSLPPDLPPKIDFLQREMLFKKVPLQVPLLPSRANKTDLTPVNEDIVPPPLPSRELIDPTREPLLPINLRPPIKTSPPSNDAAPPVPIRISSNRSAPTLTGAQEYMSQQQQRQSLSAKSSPSRSPGNWSPSAGPQQMQSYLNNLPQLLPGILNSPVTQTTRNNLSGGRTPSPPEQEVLQMSDIYDDIQPLPSPTEVEASDNSSAYYDDIEYPVKNTGPVKAVSREAKARSLADELTTKEKEFTGTYDDIMNPCNAHQSKPNAAKVAPPTQNNLVINRASNALLNSLESRFQAKKKDPASSAPPPVKPKPPLNNNSSKPRRFQAPPTKPKPRKSGPSQLENEGNAPPTRAIRLCSDPGTNKQEVGDHNHLSSLSFAPGKPTVPGKPAVSEKSVVGAKPPVSTKPHLNNRPMLPAHSRSQTDEARGVQNASRSSGEKPAAPEKPKFAIGSPVKPKVAQKPVAAEEHHTSGHFQANPSPPSPAAAAIANALTNKSGPALSLPKTGPPVVARNSSVPGKTGPLLLPTTTARTGSSLLPLATESKIVRSTSPGKTGHPVIHPKPPKPDSSPQQPPPLPGVAFHESWQRPPAIIPPVSKLPPPIRPKPT